MTHTNESPENPGRFSVEQLFVHAAAAVKRGLLVPAVCVSYGGDLEELEALPGYSVLAGVCSNADVTLYKSAMSITGMVNLGTHAVSLGYAAAEDTAF